jgi:SAM-dependent methyltransferase
MIGRPFLRSVFYAIQGWLNRAKGALWSRNDALDVGLRGLDLGCGPKKRLGFTGVDRAPSPSVDIVCDFGNSPLPFPDETFDLVFTDQVLEHIKDLEKLLAEISRVMKPGARFQIGVPYAGGLRAFQDPTHVRFFTLKTFEYFIREGSRVGGWYTGKYFKRITQRHLVFGGGPLSMLMALIVNRSQALLDIYEASFLRTVPARDLQIELEK